MDEEYQPAIQPEHCQDYCQKPKCDPREKPLLRCYALPAKYFLFSLFLPAKDPVNHHANFPPSKHLKQKMARPLAEPQGQRLKPAPNQRAATFLLITLSDKPIQIHPNRQYQLPVSPCCDAHLFSPLVLLSPIQHFAKPSTRAIKQNFEKPLPNHA